MKIFDQIISLLGGKQAPQSPQAQKSQVGWNDAGNGEYAPVYNTDSAAPKYKQMPINQPSVQPMAQAAQRMTNLDQPRNPDVAGGKYKVRPDVQKAIATAAQTFNVPQGFLSDLVASESSFDPTLINMTPEGQQAGNPTGLTQFTDSTWSDLMNPNSSFGKSLRPMLQNQDRTDPQTNAMAAAYLISKGQLGRWNASEHNWGRHWTPEELEQLGFYNQDKTHVKGKRYSQLGY